MGQFSSSSSSTPRSPRVMFDETSDNGLVFCDRYLPVDLLIEIFLYVDCESLLRCQLVCKRWKILLQNYVWEKKAEQTISKPFPRYDNKLWTWSVYYSVCKKNPFERNLVRNHSGGEGMDHWNLIDKSDRWTVEEPPIGVPELPATEPMFKGRQTCFTASSHTCTKIQIIDLVAEGIHRYILNYMRPPIVVSEWYSCGWNRPAIYQLEVTLLRDPRENQERYFGIFPVIDEFQFHDILEGEKQNQWLRITHIFENYGPFLKSISFKHGGKDGLYSVGRYGCSKMAGACVYVTIPTNNVLKLSEESSVIIRWCCCCYGSNVVNQV